jgi:SagB-type dehydrogenase family enzyme
MSVGKEFYNQTKYPFSTESDKAKNLPRPALETPQSGAAITLPVPADLELNQVSLIEAINRRRSRRKFSANPLSQEELSWLLWATQGVQNQSKTSTLRTVPSGAASHPFDTYLGITGVTGLKTGLYRYLPLSHELVLIREDPGINARLASICLDQKWMGTAPVIFIWAAVPYRSTWQCNERGWRYMLFDAGHLCQNLYLACEAIDAGCCAVGTFYDDDLNQFLGLDGETSLAVYLAPVGHK